MPSVRKLAVALVCLACACEPGGTATVPDGSGTSSGGTSSGATSSGGTSSGGTSSGATSSGGASSGGTSSGGTSSGGSSGGTSSGGTSSGGASSGGASSGGASSGGASSGGTSSGGGSSGGTSSGGTVPSCSGLALCDDFEGVDAGGVPSSSRWSIVTPNCSGTGRISIDGAQAHSGSRSVRVDGGGGYCNHVFMSSSAISGLGTTVYGRFFVRLENLLDSSHVTFLAMRDAGDGGKDVRMGGQSGILMWNRESDDATLPALSPTGIGLSKPFETRRWTCIEFHVDQAANTWETWMDGVAVQGLTVDGTPTPDVDEQWLRKTGWRPSLSDFRIGWESYGGTTQTLWFDDVALSATRIGCGP